MHHWWQSRFVATPSAIENTADPIKGALRGYYNLSRQAGGKQWTELTASEQQAYLEFYLFVREDAAKQMQRRVIDACEILRDSVECLPNEEATEEQNELVNRSTQETISACIETVRDLPLFED